VAKPELGTKRLCGNCGAKFYDLSKDPIVCPKCHTVMAPAAVATRPRPEPVSASRPVAAPAAAALPALAINGSMSAAATRQPAIRLFMEPPQ